MITGVDVRPILAYFAGLCAVKNTTFGHAGKLADKLAKLNGGAIKDRTDRNDDDTISKIRAYRKEGIKVLDHIGYIGDEMRTLLKEFKENK
jgi:succinyl-CoA synthetase alpha subunit